MGLDTSRIVNEKMRRSAEEYQRISDENQVLKETMGVMLASQKKVIEAGRLLAISSPDEAVEREQLAGALSALGVKFHANTGLAKLRELRAEVVQGLFDQAEGVDHAKIE